MNLAHNELVAVHYEVGIKKTKVDRISALAQYVHVLRTASDQFCSEGFRDERI